MNQNIVQLFRRSILLFLACSNFLLGYYCTEKNDIPKVQIMVSRVSLIPLPTTVTHGRYNIEIQRMFHQQHMTGIEETYSQKHFQLLAFQVRVPIICLLIFGLLLITH